MDKKEDILPKFHKKPAETAKGDVVKVLKKIVEFKEKNGSTTTKKRIVKVCEVLVMILQIAVALYDEIMLWHF